MRKVEAMIDQKAREIASTTGGIDDYCRARTAARLGIIEGLEMAAKRVEELLGCENEIAAAIRSLK